MQGSKYTRFVELLNVHLKEQGRSGTWLAEKIFVHQATVNGWLNNHTRPGKPELVIAIARALGLSKAQREELLDAAGYLYHLSTPEPDEIPNSPDSPLTKQTWQITIQQSEADLRDQNNRRILRQKVKETWIQGVLEPSLNHETAIQLHLADRSELVENSVLQQFTGSTQLLVSSTTIVDIFDSKYQRFLILGEPGAGKTTLILDLARTLLKRAEEIPAYPSPVVFNLSSWGQGKGTLTEWLIDELRIHYDIPKKIAQTWIEQGKLLLILDGLDEVPTNQRTACVRAVNEFQEDHLVQLAICCRIADYESMDMRLKLGGAVLIQPLTDEQVDTYLIKAGPALATIRDTIQQDKELHELAQTPLILNIINQAYQNTDAATLNLTNSTQSRRQHLFDAYIKHMLGRRVPIYSPRKTVRWLQWLAIQLKQHGQTVFLIEQMQPSWLQASGQKHSFTTLIMLLAMPMYGTTLGLSIGLIMGLIWGPTTGFLITTHAEIKAIAGNYNQTELMMLLVQLANRPNGGLIICLIIFLFGGLTLGLIFGLIEGFSGRFKKINPIERIGMLRKRLESSLYTALFWGVTSGLSLGLILGLSSTQYKKWIIGLAFGLLDTLAFGVIGGLSGIFREIELIKHINWSWRQIKSNLYFGLTFAITFGLLSALLRVPVMWLLVGLFFLISPRWSSLVFMMVFARLNIIPQKYDIISVIAGGILSGIIFQPSTGTNLLLQAEPREPNHSINLSLKYSLIVGLTFLIVPSLTFGLMIVRLIYAYPVLRTDPGFNPVLITGLFFGLMFGLIIAPIGSLLGGGDVVIKHYLLRLILRREGHVPWNYVRFLDYTTSLIFLRKVGGGYIFVHRLIMDHFASLDEEAIERITTASTGQH